MQSHLIFFKLHYTEANPLTPAEIYRFKPKQNLFSNVKAIKKKKTSKLFLSNIWVLPLMAILQLIIAKVLLTLFGEVVIIPWQLYSQSLNYKQLVVHNCHAV